MASRWRREDYDAVRHDKCFSDWKILVSPSDWKEYASGRDGGERFRSRNLPNSYVGCGVYELGLTLPVWKALDLTDGRKLKSEDVIVVYVGHADHIRKRLQRYGQAGAHLEGPRSPKSPMPGNDYIINFQEPNFAQFKDVQSRSDEEYLDKHSQSALEDRYIRFGGKRSSRLEMQGSIPEDRISVPELGLPKQSPRGPRLFSEVFAMGCSIAYRWASTRSKEVAEYVVSDLTEAFDYAWNRGADSHTRSEDILAKILSSKRVSYTSCCSRSNSKWAGFPFMRKVVGIKIAAHRPAEGKVRRLPGQRQGRGLFMLLKKSPHMMIIGGKSAKHREFTKINIPVDRCGVILDNGLACNALPQKGLKRCYLHVDAKRTSRRKESKVASQDSRSGSLASDFQKTVDSRKGLSLPGVPSSCFPIRFLKKPKQQEPKRRGSVSFSTWLSRSEILKAKSMEWLVAMEEIKGRGNMNSNPYNDISTSPILKPVDLSPDISPFEEPRPVRVSRISLNINRGMETRHEQLSDLDGINYVPKVDNGMPYSIVSLRSPVRWPTAPLRETYATSYSPPRFPGISFS